MKKFVSPANKHHVWIPAPARRPAERTAASPRSDRTHHRSIANASQHLSTPIVHLPCPARKRPPRCRRDSGASRLMARRRRRQSHTPISHRETPHWRHPSKPTHPPPRRKRLQRRRGQRAQRRVWSVIENTRDRHRPHLIRVEFLQLVHLRMANPVLPARQLRHSASDQRRCLLCRPPDVTTHPRSLYPVPDQHRKRLPLSARIRSP